jgi:hypothetical protein
LAKVFGFTAIWGQTNQFQAIAYSQSVLYKSTTVLRY